MTIKGDFEYIGPTNDKPGTGPRQFAIVNNKDGFDVAMGRGCAAACPDEKYAGFRAWNGDGVHCHCLLSLQLVASNLAECERLMWLFAERRYDELPRRQQELLYIPVEVKFNPDTLDFQLTRKDAENYMPCDHEVDS